MTIEDPFYYQDRIFENYPNLRKAYLESESRKINIETDTYIQAFELLDSIITINLN